VIWRTVRIDILEAIRPRRIGLAAGIFAAVAATMGRTVRAPLDGPPPNQWDVALDLAADLRWVVWIVVPMVAGLCAAHITGGRDIDRSVVTRLGSKATWALTRVVSIAVVSTLYTTLAVSVSAIVAIAFTEPSVGYSAYARLPLQEVSAAAAGKLYELPSGPSPVLLLALISVTTGIAIGAYTSITSLIATMAWPRPWVPAVAAIGGVLLLWRAGTAVWNPLAHLLWPLHGPNATGSVIPWAATAVALAVEYTVAVVAARFLIIRRDL